MHRFIWLGLYEEFHFDNWYVGLGCIHSDNRLYCIILRRLTTYCGNKMSQNVFLSSAFLSHRFDSLKYQVYLPGLRELADTDFASVQNFVKLGLYLKKRYDKQQASWEVLILKFKNWVCLRKLHRSGLDLLPFFQVLPSSAKVFILSFGNSWSQNQRSFGNLLPELDFTKFWRNTKLLCAETLRGWT